MIFGDSHFGSLNGIIFFVFYRNFRNLRDRFINVVQSGNGTLTAIFEDISLGKYLAVAICRFVSGWLTHIENRMYLMKVGKTVDENS